MAGQSPRRRLIGEAARALAAAQVDGPWVEAQLLLAHVLRVEWSQLLLGDDVDAQQTAHFHDLLARRVAREPLQHIVGTAPFRFLELAVGPGVFVPRPETELLLDLVMAGLVPGATVVDLCSGSGALALAVAQEHPGVRVVAVENSPAALAWLQRNAAGTSVEVVDADVRTLSLNLTADVVLANPPYVPAATPVAAEVRADPPEAVFAGPDGLDLIPAVAAAAARLLRTGGRLALEHDESHAGRVRDLVAAGGLFTDVTTEPDLTGRDRFVTARRSGAAPG